MIRARVHIKEGVERGMCGSCRNALIKTYHDNSTDVVCQTYHGDKGNNVITKPILSCSDYIPKNSPTIHDMEKQAWILEVKKGNPVGFLSPDKVKSKGILDND